MQAISPTIVLRNGQWFIVVERLDARYTFGPFDKPPAAEMVIHPVVIKNGMPYFQPQERS